jgi:hypothetical protein
MYPVVGRFRGILPQKVQFAEDAADAGRDVLGVERLDFEPVRGKLTSVPVGYVVVPDGGTPGTHIGFDRQRIHTEYCRVIVQGGSSVIDLV